MLLVVAFLLLLGLVLTADRPDAPERDDSPSVVRHDAPAPRESAHAPEREEDPSRSDVIVETVAPPAPRRPCRGSPFASKLSPEPLIYAFCTLLC